MTGESRRGLRRGDGYDSGGYETAFNARYDGDSEFATHARDRGPPTRRYGPTGGA